mmetsp:Transcript_86410/g.129562  ORF Transcript_86410/g.129562 Transcript_86410/m.129562 type:complete len:226 (+) Transcript_86410:96-773(+)
MSTDSDGGDRATHLGSLLVNLHALLQRMLNPSRFNSNKVKVVNFYIQIIVTDTFCLVVILHGLVVILHGIAVNSLLIHQNLKVGINIFLLLIVHKVVGIVGVVFLVVTLGRCKLLPLLALSKHGDFVFHGPMIRQAFVLIGSNPICSRLTTCKFQGFLTHGGLLLHLLGAQRDVLAQRSFLAVFGRIMGNVDFLQRNARQGSLIPSLAGTLLEAYQALLVPRADA